MVRVKNFKEKCEVESGNKGVSKDGLPQCKKS